MLVEQYLVAVVSLPAGVFHPYSGVKTSILFLDRRLARSLRSVLFLKIEHDGFGLGAQRRPTDKNDIPAAAARLKAWLHAPDTSDQSDQSDLPDPPHPAALIVPKEETAANGDYNLSGERYREGATSLSAFSFVQVGDVLGKVGESVLPESLTGPVTYIGLENITQGTGKLDGVVLTENPATIKSLKNVLRPGDILYGKLRPNLNKVWLADRAGICSTDIFVVRPIDCRAVAVLYAHIFRSASFNDAVISELKGAQLPRVGWTSFAAIQIPLPPLSVQQEIVAEIEGYQKVIDGARAVLDHYRPHIPIHPDWPMVELGEVAEINPKKSEVDGLPGDTVVSFVPMTALGEHSMTFEPKESKLLSEVGASYTCFRDNDVLIAKVTPCFENGKAGIARNLSDGIGFGSSEIFVIRCSEKVLPEWAYFAVANATFRATAAEKMTGTGGLQRVPRSVLEEHTIPLPPIETQRAIVAEIEAEQALVAANRDLIARMEKKIQATLARVWGEEQR